MSNIKIREKELPGFSRRFSSMLASGMPVGSVLDSLGKQTSSPAFRTIIANIGHDVESGTPLSRAMYKYPVIFDTLYVNMVAAGETGGHLAEVLERIAFFLEASVRLKRKIRSAMMYPSLVAVIAGAITIGLVTFVLPAFASVFDQMEGELPALTRMFLDISSVLRNSMLEITTLAVLLVLTLKYVYRSPGGRYRMDAMALRMPVFGLLNRKIAASRFARTYGELIKGGIPVISALEVSSKATGNEVTGRILLQAKQTIEKGEPLSTALKGQSAFPPELIEMLQAGEKTGKVDEMLNNIANYFDEEIEATLDGLTSILNPLIIIVLGTIIGAMVIAMFLPIIKLPGIV